LQDGITNRVGSDEFLPVCSPSLLLLSFCLTAETGRHSGGFEVSAKVGNSLCSFEYFVPFQLQKEAFREWEIN
jgi:hypothetical protein